MAKRNMRTCLYHSDEGKVYLKRMDARYQSQNTGGDTPAPLLGAVPATVTEMETASESAGRVRPRSVLLRTAEGDYTARVPVFTVARYNAIGLGDTITFYDGQGAAHTGVVYGKEGERLLHKSDTV